MARAVPDPPSPARSVAGTPWSGPDMPAANEERFRHLIDANPAITWTADAEGRLTYFNRRLVEYAGEPPPTMGEWAQAFVHPGDLQRRNEAWGRARATGTPYDVELRLRRRDGTYRWFQVRAEPRKDASGRVLEWYGTAMDIDQVKRSENNLRFLADASVALGELRDVDGTLSRIAHLAVPYFCDWCEVTLKDGTGNARRVAVNHWDPDKLRLAEELHRRYPRSENHGALKVIRTGETTWVPDVNDAMLEEAARDAAHLEMIRKLGLRSYLCVPMRSKSRILGALTFATAESGRQYTQFDAQVAEELARRAAVAVENAELVQALREADRRKDEFLAVLAHELRNPLAPVRNAVEILRASGSPSPQVQWTHDVIDRQVRQMARLVDDLLDVSRITSGKIELRRERVELAAAVRIALEASRPLIERGGHELTVRMPPEPAWLQADLARLAQVFANLLNNAAKFTPPGGHIGLVAERQGDRLVIRVSDNGIGIPKGMTGRIFEMFTQGGRATDRSQGGLGIGLTLVKRLVEMHGGSVEAKSEGPGRGSEFVVSLPLAEPDRPDPGEAQAAAQPAERCAPCRVLVVDDNRDTADSLSMLLVSRGHEVRAAYDGLEAVGAAVAFRPDVVLMDIGLPKLYGYDAAQRIREALGSSVLLVAITGWGQDEDRRRSRDAGFDHHLTKPVDPEAINQLIDQLRSAPQPGRR